MYAIFVLSIAPVLLVVVVTSLEELSITITESDGQYMTCVIKDLDTIRPLTVEIFDVDRGSAQRIIGIVKRAS